MAHAPKKRLLPKHIEDKPDAAVAEKLFGKQAKRELDRLLDMSKESMTKE